VNWDSVERELRTGFGKTVADLSGTRVLVPSERFDVVAVLAAAEEPHDRDHDESLYPLLSLDDEDSWPARDLLAIRWPLQTVIGFEWPDAITGQTLSVDALVLADEFTCVFVGGMDQRYATVAAIAGTPTDAWSWLFEDMCATNGDRYGMPLFGSPPTWIDNHSPDLVPEEAVRRGLRRWLDEWAQGWGWDELTEELQDPTEDPREHVPSNDELFEMYFQWRYREHDRGLQPYPYDVERFQADADKADVSVNRSSSSFLVQPNTSQVREWLRARRGEQGWMGGALVVAYDEIANLVDQLEAAGYSIWSSAW
jgi:hypothetical protein